ncbi:MAG: CotH kinase family protein [Bacteroidales bacterium]|nr:CotH kinase family protein [Bacteroidales bacterium]
MRVSISLFVLFLSISLFAQQGVPELHIYLSDGAFITDISKEEKINGTMVIKNANGSNFQSEHLYNGIIAIRGRGNSSWNNSPKKSYSIDLTDASGKKIKSPLLGMPTEEDWILNANYFDKTMLRNYYSYYFAREIGMDWASKGWFVELYVNNEYQGVYLLCENIKRSESRVNVKKAGTAGNSLTGGYIIELDYPQRLESEGAQYFTSSRQYEKRYYYDTPATDYLYFAFKYPKDEDRSPVQTAYMRDFITRFEDALYSDNFADPIIGYRKYIDVESFVDWYIVSEMANDWDHCYYLSSVFFYKQQGQGEKLKIGPVWDYDVAYKTYTDSQELQQNSPWFKRLWEDESFQKLVMQKLADIDRIIEKSIEHVTDVSRELNCFGAIDRNFQKWPILGDSVWREKRPYPHTYDGEVRKFTQWVREKYVYLTYRAQSTGSRCDVLKNLTPGIRIEDQDKYDETVFPLKVTTSSVSPGARYTWNGKNTVTTNEYTITSPGEYRVSINVNGCESLVSETLYVPGIRRESQIITFNLQETIDISAGSVKLDLDASSSSGLPVSYYIVSGQAKIQDNQLIFDRFGGIMTIGAYQKGDKKFLAATPVLKSIEVTGGITHVQDVPDVSAKVYPNPTRDILYVSGFSTASPRHPVVLELFDMTGKLRQKMTISSGNEWIMNMADHPSGVYLLRITTGNQTIVRKCIKE